MRYSLNRTSYFFTKEVQTLRLSLCLSLSVCLRLYASMCVYVLSRVPCLTSRLFDSWQAADCFQYHRGCGCSYDSMLDSHWTRYDCSWTSNDSRIADVTAA